MNFESVVSIDSTLVLVVKLLSKNLLLCYVLPHIIFAGACPQSRSSPHQSLGALHHHRCHRHHLNRCYPAVPLDAVDCVLVWPSSSETFAVLFLKSWGWALDPLDCSAHA